MALMPDTHQSYTSLKILFNPTYFNDPTFVIMSRISILTNLSGMYLAMIALSYPILGPILSIVVFCGKNIKIIRDMSMSSKGLNRNKTCKKIKK